MLMNVLEGRSMFRPTRQGQHVVDIKTFTSSHLFGWAPTPPAPPYASTGSFSLFAQEEAT